MRDGGVIFMLFYENHIREHNFESNRPIHGKNYNIIEKLGYTSQRHFKEDENLRVMGPDNTLLKFERVYPV